MDFEYWPDWAYRYYKSILSDQDPLCRLLRLEACFDAFRWLPSPNRHCFNVRARISWSLEPVKVG